MASGYDWWFEEPAAVGVQWAGLMCDNVSNFNWSSSPTRSEVSPELQDILDSNSLKCPADFDGERWVPLQKKDYTRFQLIDTDGMNGFLIDSKSRSGIRRSRFCFVRGQSVLIGVAGGGANIESEKNYKSGSLLNVLQSIEFKPDMAPSKQ
jgi:hypothetical protein